MDHLFETIKNMSKAERLFFRRNFSENNKAQYIAVYDAIVKSGSENEALLNKLVNKICAGHQNYI